MPIFLHKESFKKKGKKKKKKNLFDKDQLMRLDYLTSFSTLGRKKKKNLPRILSITNISFLI
jgi:hypothetical protein